MRPESFTVMERTAWAIGLIATVACGLSSSLTAQVCDPERTGSVVGTVQIRDDRGVAWGYGAPEPVEHVLLTLGDGECKALTNEQGRFLIQGVREGSHVLRVEPVGWPPQYDTVQVVSDSIARVDVLLTTPSVVHEFSDFASRPKVVANPTGVAGCYWFGGTPYRGQVIRLGSDGTVQGFDSRVEWQAPPNSGIIKLAAPGVSVLWGETATIEVGDNPDWSDLHVRYSRWSDTLEPYNPVWETFATRVPCADWGNTLR